MPSTILWFGILLVNVTTNFVVSVDFLIIDKPIIIEQLYSPQYLTVLVFTVQYSKIVSRVAIPVLIAKDLINAVGE